VIIIKSDQEIEIMRQSGKVAASILQDLYGMIRPGISTKDIDDFVEEVIRKHNMTPSFKGYNGFPAAACVSINEEVIHGIPSRKRLLREGDIVSVDVGCTHMGYITDAARTYAVGQIDAEAARLIRVAEESFFDGLAFCRIGHRLSDISHAIQRTVEGAGFGVVRDFVGHGVGREMHEEPQIPNYGNPGRGPRLAKGMVFAIEPMISQGGYAVEVELDNWTAVIKDRSLAAHYENTVVITDGEPELLTVLKESE